MTAVLEVPADRRFRWSVERYLEAVEAGVLGPDDRVELLAGEVVDKVGIGSRHAAVTKAVNQTLVPQAVGRCVVGVQDPVRLLDSVPEPDVSVLRFRDDLYVHDHPGAGDVVLLVEVADSSAAADRRQKVPLYLVQGVVEVWLVDLVAGVLQVHRPGREPVGLQDGVLAPESAADLRVDVGRLLAVGRG